MQHFSLFMGCIEFGNVMQLLKFRLWSYLTGKNNHSFTFITNEYQIVTLQLMAILSRVSENK